MSIYIEDPIFGTNVVTNPTFNSSVHSKNGSFKEDLYESSVNAIIQDIHDKFGLNVGESGYRIECYIPGDVLYQMSKDDALKKDIYSVLEDYTCTEFKVQMDTLDPPVKTCKLIFDKDASVIATLEADTKKLEQEYEQLKKVKKTLPFLGPVSKKSYDIQLEMPEDNIPDIQIQGAVASSLIKGLPTK